MVFVVVDFRSLPSFSLFVVVVVMVVVVVVVVTGKDGDRFTLNWGRNANQN